MNTSNRPQQYGVLWTREELVLAFDLYCRIPFRQTKANNPAVIELARLLKRSPASVARKLGNFGAFDPQLQQQQITGLVHTGKLDHEIWNEFNEDWNALVLEANRLKESLGLEKAKGIEGEADLNIPRGASEKEAMRKIRIHQSFFREAILSGYEETCCITGLKIKECLIASHIIPWSAAEEHRADPRNGLCLSATFDRLFDRGLITIASNGAVIIAKRLHKMDDARIAEMICKYHGALIGKPKRFLPSPGFLEWHRVNVFEDWNQL